MGGGARWSCVLSVARMIRKRGDSYEIQVYVAEGVPRLSATATSKEQARVEERRLRAQVASERGVRRRRLSLGQLFEQYMLNGGPKGPVTRKNYEGNFWNHVAPDLNRMQVVDLAVGDLDDLYRRLARPVKDGGKGLSPGTVKKVHVVVSAMLAYAKRKGMVSVNVARDATVPSVRKRSGVESTAVEEIRWLLDQLRREDPPFALQILVAAATGARRSEVVALQWRDVNWITGDLKIRRKALSLRNPDGDGPLVESGSKTDGGRTIALDESVVAQLRAHHVEIKAMLAMMGADLRPEAYIFSPEVDGSVPYFPTSVSRKLAVVRRRHGLSEDVTWLGLRHHAATTMIGNSVDPRVAAERLGNSPSVCLDVYADVMPAKDQAAAKLLGGVLGATSAPTVVQPGLEHLSTEQLLAEVARRMGGSS